MLGLDANLRDRLTDPNVRRPILRTYAVTETRSSIAKGDNDELYLGKIRVPHCNWSKFDHLAGGAVSLGGIVTFFSSTPCIAGASYCKLRDQMAEQGIGTKARDGRILRHTSAQVIMMIFDPDLCVFFFNEVVENFAV